MGVLLSDRNESRFEPIVFSIEIHNMLIELMQRDFGVKDLEHIVQRRYAIGVDDIEDYGKYRALMRGSKERIDYLAASLTGNVRAANRLYPTSMHEYERRRDFQNFAIVNCDQIVKELQHVVDIFDVDINIYSTYIKAIDREIGLIKKWRQSDNKIKAYLTKG